MSDIRIPALACMAMLAVALIVIAGAPPAAIAAPPAKADCGSFTDVFERAKCRHDAVADQMAYTADTAFKPDTVVGRAAGLERRAHMGNARARGQRAKNQTSMAVFKKLAKAEVRGNRKAGHLVPLSGFDDTDGDGICDFEQGVTSAQCAAVELDEFGALQACNPKKKNKGKGKPGSDDFGGLECDLSFDPENAADPAEAADMEQAAQEMEEAFGAVEDDFIEMNGHLDDINVDGPAPLRAAAAGGCVIPNFSSAASDAALALRLSTATAQGASSIMDSNTSQIIVVFGHGFNVRATASFLNYAKMAIELAYITVDELNIAQNNLVQAATNACVADAVKKVGEVADQIATLRVLMAVQHVAIEANDNTNAAAIETNDNANTAALRARLDAVEAELSRLLNTPHGQRDGFPTQ